MQVRVVTKNDKGKTYYKVLSYKDFDDYNVVMDMFHKMKQNSIPIEVNNNNMADTDGDRYYIEDISFVVPGVNSELNPYISVYVEE